MPKSAFKLKAIHLHIFDYSVNLPPVFFTPTNHQLCHTVELFIVDDEAAVGGKGVYLSVPYMCAAQRCK